jgi:DNA-directed RNA polymerase specialized sigma24 family protein
MAKEPELTPEAFELLLKWLDLNRDKAGEKYEAIRHRLITFFYGRGCLEADRLTDRTLTVVAGKVPQLIGHYKGDPTYYFIGVARKIYQEYLRSERRTSQPPPPRAGWTEREYQCLEQCLENLTPHARPMFEEYYCGQESDRISLAGHFGISLNALRIRVHRIRATLKACVKDCIDREGE